MLLLTGSRCDGTPVRRNLSEWARNPGNVGSTGVGTLASGGEVSLWRFVARGASAIVPFNENGDRPPFYCVHSIGGEVTSYVELARLLGAEQQFYGIQAPKEKLSIDFASSVYSIAKYYADTLTDFQPEGPLVLGGWSVGSVIALEMAQQLQARGRAVRLLVVFDGILSNTGVGITAQNPLYYLKLARNLPRFTRDLLEERQIRTLVRRVNRKVRAMVAYRPLAPRGQGAIRHHAVDGYVDTTGWPHAHVLFARSLHDAVEAYVPKAYHGRVLVYAAKTQPFYHLLQVDAAWESISTRIEIVHIDGTHRSMLREPRVICVANHLRERLTEFSLEGLAQRRARARGLTVVPRRGFS
jgi:thioesterase domain-containing protein